MGDTKPYLVVATNVIPQVTQVHVYEETLQHIEEFSLQLPSFMIAIESGLTHAATDWVFADRGGPGRPPAPPGSPPKAYVFVSRDNTFNGENFLHLAVQRVGDGTSARLTTGYFTSDIYPGIPVWSANNA